MAMSEMNRYCFAIVLMIWMAFVPVVKADTLFVSDANSDLVWEVSVIGYVQPYPFSNDTYWEIEVKVTNTGTQDVAIWTWDFYAKTESNRQVTVDLFFSTFSGMTLRQGLYTSGMVAFLASQTDPVAMVGYTDNLYSINETLAIPEYSLVVLVLLPFVGSISVFLIRRRRSLL